MKSKKVAFCFSGQARSFESCYPYIKEHLLDPLGKNKKDYDIFCCIEDDKDAKKVKLLKPTKVLKTKTGDFSKDYEHLIKLNYNKFLIRGGKEVFSRHLNQLKKVWLANKIKNDYSKKNNVKYKFVMRIRFDLLPLKPINYKKLQEGILYLPSRFRDLDGTYNDIFAIGDYDIMDKYCERYLEYERAFKKFFIPNIKISERVSLLLEKYYDITIKYLFMNGKKKSRKKDLLLENLMKLKNLLFITPIRKYQYSAERHLYEHIKIEGLAVEELDFDSIIVREDSSQCLLSMRREHKI